ncbi:hypothetical protein NHX12_021726 [Muraenolepis orangiensis]|uniref:Beta-1,4-galactosyltransferase n=1 Tax=Muraenolepis orangiensis TaxID=630683 RepID=A0A9Q0ISM1_9TELE|nr:hypothetical protein NHX12_021726 [Muraenolepis orangiensis]
MNKRYLRLLVVTALLAVSYRVTVWMHDDHTDDDDTTTGFGSPPPPTPNRVAVDPSVEEDPGLGFSDEINHLGLPRGSSPPLPHLPLCPSFPPKLEGPLRIEFDWTRTMDDVHKESGPGLQEGGRFQPPDCISQHKVAIIIPFRNRAQHLKHWLYYLHPILKRQQLDYGVYVIHQHGNGTFNRAKLLNVGFVEALKEYAYDCFVFSDVDLVPMNDRNIYRCHDQPRHLSAAMDKFGFRLPYKTYFGGVVSLSREQYMRINGFPNEFWGWGGEDDDMYSRVMYKKMEVSRPDNRVGMYKMVRHARDLHNEENPHNAGKLGLTRLTMDADGINSLRYTLKHVTKHALYTMVTVDLHGPK